MYSITVIKFHYIFITTAVFNPKGGNRTIFSDAIPGWSLHDGEASPSVSTSNLVDVNQLSATDAPALHAQLDRIGVDRAQPNYARFARIS